MNEWAEPNKIAILNSRSPTKLYGKNAEATDSWNFVNCDKVMFSYPSFYFEP